MRHTQPCSPRQKPKAASGANGKLHWALQHCMPSWGWCCVEHISWILSLTSCRWQRCHYSIISGVALRERGVLKTLRPVDLPILLLCFVPTLLALLLGAGIGQVWGSSCHPTVWAAWAEMEWLHPLDHSCSLWSLGAALFMSLCLNRF